MKPVPNEAAAEAPLRSMVEDVTCPACGCLCDDLRVSVEGDRIVAIEAACPIGTQWFHDEASRPVGPAAFIDGVPATPEAALDRAAAILRAARCPGVFGLTQTVLETTREALALADSIGARVVLSRSEDECRRLVAFQNQGRVSATLGEVKTRADAILFWRCDPVRTHPRHLERYSADAVGRFVPAGRAGRLVIAADSARTATTDAADVFVPLPIGDDLAAFKALRMLLAGRAIDPALLGLDEETLAELTRQSASRKYWAVFAGADEEESSRSSATWEELTRLVRDANSLARVVLLGLGRAGNLAGAEAMLTWQTGFLGGAELSPGGPRPLAGRGTLADMLESGEPDAVLAIGDGWPRGLSDAALKHLSAIPTVMIGRPATFAGSPPATVALGAATPAIDTSGTIVRVDGVCLPVRALFRERLPSDRQWLERLRQRLEDGAAPP
jgi:formylmethanofuran dehydrogenase subunit B